MPPHHFGRLFQLSQAQRVDLIRRLFYDQALALDVRAAGLLVLLYAQPVTAIVRLSTTDVVVGPEVMIRLHDEYVPVPKPFDEVLARLASRAHEQHGGRVGPRWLFVGRVPGRSRSAHALRVQLNTAGVPVQAGRNSALAALVAELPAALVADAVGIHPSTANRWASEAAVGWRSYARTAGRRQRESSS